jgi:hypothetical protein
MLLNPLGKTLSIGAIGLLAACGSVTPNEEPSGSGGDGGDGRSPGAGDIDARQACLDYCHQLNVNGCNPTETDCAAFCEDRFESSGAECEDETGKVFACALPFAASCPRDVPPLCQNQMDGLDACVEMHGCSPQECSGGGNPDGDMVCACESTCQGKRYETRCETPAGGTATCTCLMDGVEIGACNGEGTDVCKIKQGCCQEAYFKIP